MHIFHAAEPGGDAVMRLFRLAHYKILAKDIE
jgi:hypothetical protein